MNALIIFGAKYLIYVLILIAAAYIFTQYKRNRRDMLLFFVLVLPLSYVIAKIGSFLYYDPRPFVVGNFAPLVPHVADNGFPSDHTLLASAVAMAIFPFNKKLGLFLLVLALAVGFSRVLAGVHHFVDILGSVTVAAIVSWVSNRWIMPRFKDKAQALP